MTIDELISALQKIKDDYGSCLPVLMLDSSGILSAVESVDSDKNAVIIVSQESEDEEDENELDWKPSAFTLKQGLISSFLSAHSCSKKEACYNTRSMGLIITKRDIFEGVKEGILSKLPNMINDGWKVHYHAIDFVTDNIIVTLCRED